MGLFSKKEPTDLGMYHLPLEMVLMNYHDIHDDFVADFLTIADATCASEGATMGAVEAAMGEVMGRWDGVESHIRTKLAEDAAFLEAEAAKNGLTKYYTEYVTTRIGLFRFTIGYRMMNAMTSYCEEHGIPMSD